MIRKNSTSTAKINIHKLEDPHKVLAILLDETKEERDLRMIIEERYVRQLIGGATMSLSADPGLIRSYRLNTRRELRRELKRYTSTSMFSRKLKFCSMICNFPNIIYDNS